MKNIARLIGWYLNTLAWISPREAGKRGFNVFCTPVPPPVKDHHRAYFETAAMDSFDHNGSKIQTYRWGTGPRTVLFLHGWQSHSFRWKNYIDAFVSDGYTVYALDAPAHGLSGGKYINLVIYAGVIEQFIANVGSVHAIVSHSFGSFASLYALHRSPGLPVERLVITGTPGEANEFFAHYRTLLGLTARTEQIILDEFVRTIGHGPDYFSAPAFASTLNLPGLIVHDAGDEETPYRHAERIHSAWKNSRMITTTGLGHNLRSPDVINHVREFVSERQPVTAG